MKNLLKTAPRGTVFGYAGQRWIVLEHDNTGKTLCLTEEIVEDRAFDDGNCNDFSKSSSLRYLNGHFLDTMIDAAGCSSAFLTSELDLTADDGLKDYGTCTVTIFLLTVDQYRRNRDVIPNADDWWWLSTAFSTASNGYEHSARIVINDGALNGSVAYYGYGGLRPACYLNSDLLISPDGEDVSAEQAGEKLESPMTVNDYQEQAGRTMRPGHCDNLANVALGLTGEAGEVADEVKKYLFQGHPMDKDHLIEELGDVAWYLALGAFALNTDLETIFRKNIEKLREKYPDGFKEKKD